MLNVYCLGEPHLAGAQFFNGRQHLIDLYQANTRNQGLIREQLSSPLVPPPLYTMIQNHGNKMVNNR